MKMQKLLGLIVLVSMVAVTGCNNKNKTTADASVPLGNDVLAVEPTSNEPAPIPSIEPTATPTLMAVSNDITPAPAMGGAGTSYKVKKGDTLYGIARAQYGDGKQWQKIAQANPGLTPTSLKAGSTISIP